MKIIILIVTQDWYIKLMSLNKYEELLEWHKTRVFEIYERDVAGQLHMDAIDWVTKTRAFDKRLEKKNKT